MQSNPSTTDRAATTGPNCPSTIENTAARLRRSPVLMTPVGANLHGVTIEQADHDLERQILMCAERMEQAHARYMAEPNRADRMAARAWQDEMMAAIARRRADVQQAFNAAVLQRVEGAS